MDFTHNITRTRKIKEGEKLILDSNTFQPFLFVSPHRSSPQEDIFICLYPCRTKGWTMWNFQCLAIFFSAKIITSYGSACYFSVLNLTFCTIFKFSLLLGSFHCFHFHDCPIFYKVNALTLTIPCLLPLVFLVL